MPRSKSTGKIIRTFYTGDRMISVRLITLNCVDCGQPFNFEMTTKAAKRCTGCTEKAIKAKRKRDYWEAKRRAEGKTEVSPKARERPKIRYAGWDPGERKR